MVNGENNIVIKELNGDSIYTIKSLWEELNEYHKTSASEFKQYFEENTFEKRVEKLLVKEKLRIDAAYGSHEIIGYCISSINDKQGEIDSLYVRPSYRELDIGSKLMDRHLLWFEKENVADIKIIVVSGNEAVISFYEKYQFKTRKYEMSRVNKPDY